MDCFGVRLKEERKKMGLNQQDFAKLGGVEANTQYLYENDKRLPRADYLAAIALEGIDVLYILLGVRTLIAADGLNDAEMAMVQDYRSLKSSDQNAIGQLSSSLSDCD